MAKTASQMRSYRKKKRQQQKAPVAMTEDEYLGMHGYSSPISDYTVDKVRIPHGETQRQKDKRIKEGAIAASEYQKKRDELKAEYAQKVESGEIRPKTKIEKMIETAHGESSNPSVQAARRVLEKRGYDWKTGKKVKQNAQSPAVTITFKDGSKRTFKQGNGVLLSSDALDGTFNPVKGVSSIDKVVSSAKKNGFKVTEHSEVDIKQANAARNKRKSENATDIALGEMQPNKGKAGISAKRLVTRKSDYKRSR